MSAASTSTDGYLSSTDWTVFNNKADKQGFKEVSSSTYTVIDADRNSFIALQVSCEFTLDSAITNSWDPGDEIEIVRMGGVSPATTISITGGPTAYGLSYPSGSTFLEFTSSYEGVRLKKIDANTWLVIDL